MVPTGASYASSKPFLEALRVKGSTPVLVNSSHETLYLLSSEKSSHLHCSGACLTYWPPVLVKKSIARVSLGPGVRGKVGFVARPGAMKQVTFNSYPLYRFAGDGRAGSTNGEGLVSYGGTWYVLKAASTTANATPLKKFVTRPAPAGY
ncbi:MAG: hypothetical protein HIU57_08380 [Acidobacteria bacterium]|nr:hypothetical protein [Acidobacteriota bacterium]